MPLKRLSSRPARSKLCPLFGSESSPNSSPKPLNSYLWVIERLESRGSHPAPQRRNRTLLMQGSNSPEVRRPFLHPYSSHKKYGMPPATFLLFISRVARQITPLQIQQLSIFVAWAHKSRENPIDQALYEGANYGLEQIELR